MRNFKMAVCQNKPSEDKKKSVEKAVAMIREAASEGASLVTLPEIFYHTYVLPSLPSIAERNNETLNKLVQLAKELKIYLCTGSMVEENEKGERFNKTYFIAPEGKILLEYSKSHLFDVDIPNLCVKESAVFTPGDSLKTVETPLCRIGLLICYDFRFPETARKLALDGAELIIIPAAFNTITGPAHWEVMLRTRAIENQLFIAAASPARNSKAAYKAYGHSMLIDPWGTILAEAGSRKGIIYAEFDRERLEEIRKRLPLLKHRRPGLYI